MSEQPQEKTYIAVPIRFNGHVLGVIHLHVDTAWHEAAAMDVARLEARIRQHLPALLRQMFGKACED